MIQKTYTEGILLEREGPVTTRTVTSHFTSAADKSYISSITLAPSLTPKRTFFTLDGVLPRAPAFFDRSCSLDDGGEKSYGSSVSLRDVLPNGTGDEPKHESYFQSIELELRLLVKDFSETIHNFPRAGSHSFVSCLVHDPCHVKENYVSGVRVDIVKDMVLTTCEDEFPFTSSMHIEHEGFETLDKRYSENILNCAHVLNGI